MHSIGAFVFLLQTAIVEAHGYVIDAAPLHLYHDTSLHKKRHTWGKVAQRLFNDYAIDVLTRSEALTLEYR